jgi:hypothetical protein
LSAAIGPSCIIGSFPVNPATNDYGCRVVARNTLPDHRRIDTVIPPCSDGATSGACWVLVDGNGTNCSLSAKQLIVNRNGTAPPTDGTAFTCAPCPTDHAEIGCP